MKVPENNRSVLFGGTYILANKLQWVADRTVPGISSKQWFLLRTLSEMPEEPAPAITRLARELDTTRQNAAKMLEVMRRQGYVVLGGNPGDRRSTTVKLTDEGRRILGVMSRQSQAFFEKLFAGISDGDCAAAAGVTVRMIENLLKMQQEMEG